MWKSGGSGSNRVSASRAEDADEMLGTIDLIRRARPSVERFYTVNGEYCAKMESFEQRR